MPLAEQDRGLWDTGMIAEGVEILQAALARDRLGEFQAQAAVAALHADASAAEETDWVQIVEWYDELAGLTDSPVVRLNRAVAVGEADGPRAGLAELAALSDSLPRRTAVAAYLHERDGDLPTAARLYAEAAHKAPTLAERDTIPHPGCLPGTYPHSTPYEQPGDLPPFAACRRPRVKFRTRSSAIIGTLCLVTSLALATASADKPPAPAQQVSASLTEVARAQSPSAGAAGPDGTVWIAERAGSVKGAGRLRPRGTSSSTSPTTTDGERGLLGVAFDKTFTHFYISYTDLEGTSTIDEFAVEGGITPDGYTAHGPHPDAAVREPQRRRHQVRPRRLPVHRPR
ncbi:hypothetical protein SBADM41S_10847 [Streptomyces badius]